MTPEEFEKVVSKGGTVPLDRESWEGLASHFQEMERHGTQLAGDLIIVRIPAGLVAVEAPSRDARVARFLGGEKEARDFVARRMEEYERMWDGCGVKVDYYEAQ